jgi:ElaB/YqjD/DUF883 family membrane-anchored ribosome-binding protein
MMKSLHQPAAEHDFRNAVSDVEDVLDSAGQRSRAGIRDLQDRALGVLDDARQRLGSLDSQVRSSARQAAAATEDYVHDQPWRALGLGAAAGVLLGLAAGVLLAARRR